MSEQHSNIYAIPLGNGDSIRIYIDEAGETKVKEEDLIKLVGEVKPSSTFVN